MMTALNELSDELVRSAVAGDAAAVRAIVEALSGPFLGMALRMLNNHADAEEATQEALIRVTTRLSTFDGCARFSTWAFRVAVRCVLDYKSGRARRPLLSFDAFTADLHDGLDAHAPMPDDQLMLQQLKVGCGRALLQCLDGEHRIAYVLGEVLSFEGPEAAAVLELEPAMFRKRLSRAREKIRTHLRSQCGIVQDAAPCRCHGRLGRARSLNRLDARDREGQLDVEKLRVLIRSLPVLDQAAAYYRADPSPVPREQLLERVRLAIGA